jgi:hypothetical protein
MALNYEGPAIERRVKLAGPVITAISAISAVIATPVSPVELPPDG